MKSLKVVTARSNSPSISSALRLMGCLVLTIFSGVMGAYAEPINVSSISTLQMAINNSVSGDEIVLANGTYSGATISIPSGKNGLTVRSATPGGVFLTGTVAITIDGNNDTFSGFQFNSSSSGNIVIVVRGSYNWVTQLNFDGVNATKYIHLATPGVSNVISHCNFRNKPTSAPQGNLIHVSAQSSTPGYHKIRYCSFQDMPGAGGDAGNECIRLENGAQSTHIARTVIEFCYFSNTQGGDSEAISFKCRENVVRYCTMTNNQNAQFVFRNGNDNVAYGNFFMGAGGFRVKEANNCSMYNNYFENSGVGGINGCVKYVAAAGFGANIHFNHNTVVNSGLIHFEGQTGNYWANNIFSYASGNIFSGSPSGVTFLGNIYQGTLGVSIPSGMTSVNPQLVRNSEGYLALSSSSPAIDAASSGYPAMLDVANVDDDPTLTMDISGQSRPASAILKDVGCDEYGVNGVLNRPLILSDVGPSYLGGPGSAVAAPTFSPVAGTYTSAQSVTISTTTSGATIRYTVDGSTPTSTTGTLYSTPVNINVTTTTLKAIAYKTGLADSMVTTGVYTITPCEPPAITVHPVNATTCAGSSATFSVMATGTSLAYQWQLRVDAGSSFNNVGGATSSSYTTPATAVGDSGKQYRCVVSGACGSPVTSNPAILAVNARPTSILSGSATICRGGSTTIQAALTGTGPWNVTWSDGFTHTTASPATRSVSPSSSTTYTVTALTDAQCTAQAGDRTGSAAVTVNTAPSITIQPASQIVSVGATASFSLTATGTILTYQWQSSVDAGNSFNDIGGATSSSYTTPAIGAGDNGNQYRCVVSGACAPAVTSSAATLTVSSLPAPWLTADIGAVGSAGSASADTGAYTIKGSGAGITGTADQFRYVYQALSRDGSITARISSQSGAGSSALAGVMIRESTATGSKFGLMARQGSGSMLARRRTSTGGSVANTTGSLLTPPACWVRMTRSGNTIQMLQSSDGINWTSISSSSISMAKEITIGLIVTSGSNSALDTDVFDNVTVVP